MDTEQTPQQPTEAKPRKIGGGFGLIAIQSISCAVVVLAVLILRLVGGDVFQQLRVYFQDAMQQNALTAAIHALWGEETFYPTADTDTAPTTASAAGGDADMPDNVATAALAMVQPALPPVEGAVVTSGFGMRDDPFGGGEREFHRGVDLGAPQGTPIAAMWQGEVTAADSEGNGSLGRYVRLRHEDGVEVLYAHCDTVTAAVGDTVSAGQTVATVGATGRATGAHLHLQVEQNGKLCDPMPLLPEKTYV